MRLNRLFDEYLVYGGYPEVVLADTEEERQEILKELIYSYMKKDALEAGIREEQKFFQLTKLLADQTGSLVNNNELGNTLQMAGSTVDNYIYLLQKGYIVDMLTPFLWKSQERVNKNA